MKKLLVIPVIIGAAFILMRKKPEIVECGYHILSDINGIVTFALTIGDEVIDIISTDDYWEGY